jgi:uncharacterized membrane protein
MAEEVQTPEAPQASKKSGTGLEPNVAAMLAYLFGWLSGLIIFLIEKDDKFVRFAAMQSIVLSLALTVLSIVYSWVVGALVVSTILTGGAAIFGILSLVSWVVWIGFLVVWIMLMVKAYQGQEWELPVIGKIARNFVK